MKILLAGATGTLGGPLVSALAAAGHEVVGLTRTPDGARALAARGATAVIADAMDRDQLLTAVDGMRADAVIHEMTALAKAPVSFADMRATNRLREVGSAHLIEAAGVIGATRFITQSIVFGYGYSDHGERLLSEESPFGVPRGDRTDEPIAAMVSAEQQAFSIGGIALRYGLFYGDDLQKMRRMLDRWSLPVPARWGGSIPLVHHRDAAAATVVALERGIPGRAYNVVDDGATSWRALVQAVATATGARKPLAVPDRLLRAVAPYAGVMMTRVNMRVSNELAGRELGWAPAYPTVAEGVRA